MTIADRLTSINSSKTAIKTAIEAKGVTVGTAPLSSYAGLIDTISGAAEPAGAWVRSTEWLAMPSVVSTENKVCMLVAIHDTDTNNIALSVDTIGFTINWGDGVTESFAGGVTASHNYSYSNSALNGSLTSFGYKQAIITITPTTGGQNFPVLRFQNRYAGAPATLYNSQILDIVISAPACTYMSFGGASTVRHSSIERIRILSNNLNDVNQMFTNCYALQELELSGIGTATTTTSMFQNCRSLSTVPLFDTSGINAMTAMFNSCSSLTEVPLFNTINVTNMSTMFNGCSSLHTVPLFNTVAVTTMSSMFASCISLTLVPLFNTANVTTMNAMFSGATSLITVPLFNTIKVTDTINMFLNCSSLSTVPLFNTPALLSASTMFSGCASLQSIPALTMDAVTVSTSFAINCTSLSRCLAKTFYQNVAFTSGRLSATALNEIYVNLPKPAAIRTIGVNGNVGGTGIVRTGTLTLGSKVITAVTDTSNLVVGQRILATNITTTSRIATADITTNVLTLSNHGISNGEIISFTSIGTLTGVATYTMYYIVNSNTNTFQIAATLGGAAIDLTGTNGSMSFQVDAYIVSIVANTSVTMSVFPTTAGTAQTITYRNDNVRIANFKNWTVA